jgi:ribonucleoside-diphosphate reductase alpha chain
MTTEIAPKWMSEEALHTLSSGYLIPGETPKDMMIRLASTAAKINQDPTLEEDVLRCLWDGWIGPASPVCSNLGTNRGFPISCFALHISNSVASIYSHLKEAAQLSKNGGGVGVYYGDISPSGTPISSGGSSIGVVPWAQQYDLCSRIVSQGGVRRGSFSNYLPISHPDVWELLRAKDHSKGDPRKFLDGNIALTITDEWIESMISGDKEKQELFGEVLKTRMISGSPYLIFIDNANRQNPKCYVERGLSVKTSNLCSEVFLHTDEHHTFVCVLSSINLSKYDEFRNWRSPVSGRTVPQIGIHFLEAVVSEFIRRAKDKVGMGRSVRFAEKSRALGLGVMGLHTLYQKRGYPFKSDEARQLNIEAHKWIKRESEFASKELAKRFGEPEWCEGTGMRHTHLLAIAPTRTNSVISGAFSQGIEPIDRNYFVAKQAKGTYVRKNPVLEELLLSKGLGPEVWDQILDEKGSVQNLNCLTDEEKEIFKTAREIDQFELVKQASDRQPFICQGQSLNLFVDPEADASYLFRLHLSAWKMGLKSLYYLKSTSLLTKKTVPNKDEKGFDSGLYKNLLITKEGCPWCIKLKEQLNRDGISYKEVTLNEAKVNGMWDESKMSTVPQLNLFGQWVGGYNDYMEIKEDPTIKVNEEEIDYNECTACEA